MTDSSTTTTEPSPVESLVTQAKVTWKSIVAVATALAGALSAANVAGFDLPPSLSKEMVLIGVGALFVERLAETVDNFVKVKWGSISPAVRQQLIIAGQKIRSLPVVQKLETSATNAGEVVIADIDHEIEVAKTNLGHLLGIAGKDSATVSAINPAPPVPVDQPVSSS